MQFFIDMKKIQTLFCAVLLGCMTVAFAQNTGIIPTPQKVELHSGKYLLQPNQQPDVQLEIIATFPVDTNPDQGYILQVLPNKILIQATTETGLFYGQQSVKQLMRFHCKDSSSIVEIPCMKVVDYPLMKYRGWMDDISRGPIVNMEFLKSQIETFAEYKINFFNLYTEHVFKLDRYPDIAPTDGLTAAEIKELEAFAAQYHVEIFGNQQCLAHAEKTLRIPFYQDFADTKVNYNPGVPRTYEFLKYQLKTVAQAYQSPFFNIDCDETEALGNGKAHDFIIQNGNASQVYVQHILKVYDILKPLGKKVMMWGDIAAGDSTITAQLPKDILMIVWSYAPSDSYVDMMKPFVKQGLDFFVAPGMSMWSSIFPRYNDYTKNIANLIRDGYHNGALGMMNTAWDDSGESLINCAWHGMAWAAEMAWKPLEIMDNVERSEKERQERLSAFNANFEVQFEGNSVDKVFNISELENTPIPEFFGNASLYDKVLDFYDSKVSDDFFLKNVNVNSKLEIMKQDYENIIAKMANLPLKNSALARLAHYACLRQQTVAQKNILRYMLYKRLQGEQSVTIQATNEIELLNRTVSLSDASLNHEIESVLKLLHQTKLEYLKLWDEECRPYSREIVERRYDQVAQDLLNVPNHVFITPTYNDAGETIVTLSTLFNDQKIYFTVDGRTPMAGDNLYEKPISITHSTTIRALTKNAMGEDVITDKYVLKHKALGCLSKLNTEYSTYRLQYAAAGKMALADGVVGGSHYADGTWQGYWGNDISADFDFGKKTTLNHFKTHVFQNVYDWIMAPNTVEIYTSKNGKDYKLYRTVIRENVDYSSSKSGIYTLQNDNLNIKARYVRVVIKNAGTLPAWHQAVGQPSYIFCDEIILN